MITTNFDRLPECVKSAVSYMAYERGHSAGEDEVDAHKEALASDLIDCLRTLEKEAYMKGVSDQRESSKHSEL